MPFDVQISLQKLLTGLIIVIVPLSIFGLYLTSNADKNLEQTTGMQFRTIALTDAATTAQFIGDRISDVSAIAADTAIVDAVKASDRQYLGAGEEAIAARIQKIEGQWDTPSADSLVKDMLSSRASRWLQQQRSLNRRLLKIIVSDENGASVAATGKPVHYAEADQQRWQAVYAGGKGAVNVTEVRYDASTQSDYVDIAVPVLEEESGRFMGVVSALVDISGLFSVFAQQHFGHSGRVMLVTSKGTIVNAPNVTPDLRLMSEEYGTVHDALATTEGRQTGYVKAATSNGDSLVGFADTELKRSQPNLDWVILVSQHEREALAPVRVLAQFAVAMVVLALLMLTGLLAYLWTQRQQGLADLVVMEPNKPTQGTTASA
jgi:Cache domain